MVFPEPCDLRGDLCYRTTYVVVALEWFVAALAFSSVECTNLVYFTVSSHLFEVLGASFSQVQADDALLVTGGGPAPPTKRSSMASPGERELRRCVRQHQALLRWSKEMTEVYSLPTFLRLGTMTFLIALSIIKPLLMVRGTWDVGSDNADLNIEAFKILGVRDLSHTRKRVAILSGRGFSLSSVNSAHVSQENYVVDELPFVGFYGTQTIFVICWFSDELNRSVSKLRTCIDFTHPFEWSI